MNLESMPSGLERIARVIGLEATRKLVAKFGGTMSNYVPVRPTDQHPWSLAIGGAAFALLCKAFGGRRIDVPSGTGHSGEKKRLIIELSATGLCAKEIARRVGCSPRYAMSVLQTEREDWGEKKRRVIELANSGLAVKEIAARAGCSEVYARSVLREERHANARGAA